MINVMVVDDSAVVRSVISEILNKEPGIKVIGTAPDPVVALGKMMRNWPDVLILDVEMPRMDGITFLRQIMRKRPTATVICSSLTTRGAETTLRAMDAGAVDIIPKPASGIAGYLRSCDSELVHSVRAAAAANLKRLWHRPLPAPVVSEKLSADVILDPPSQYSPLIKTTDRLVAIGTSTGGTQALERLLTSLPVTVPGIVIVQHMPAAFTKSFAERLNRISALSVNEAETGDRVLNGRALIAPGGRHLLVKRNGAQYVVEVVEGPPVSRHRPSVDVLFRSVAKATGRNALGIIMTGMGDDGARGMREMYDAGAYTIAQDEASCVVYGMPKEAVRHGGVHQSMNLEQISEAIVRYGFND